MMHKRAMYRAIAILLAVIICFPAFECSALAAQDGMIRVKLTRLGTRQSISFRTNCAYAIGGNTDRRIPSGANCTVTLSGGGLTLTVNGVRRHEWRDIHFAKLFGRISGGLAFQRFVRLDSNGAARLYRGLCRGRGSL